MDIENALALSNEIAAKMKRLADIKSAAGREGRDLSRRESAEVATITKEAQELGKQLPARPSGQALQGGARRDRDEAGGDTLTREQRVSDWIRERGSVRGGFGYDAGEQLSLGKMVRGAVTGSWKDAEQEQRALGESVLANGGYLLAPELAGQTIDRVRSAMQVMRAGATTVPMTTQQLYLARLASGASVSWKAEGDTITDSSPQFERVVLTAKTLPVLVKISAELFEDLSPEATDLIEREISLALSLELDRACLRADGSGASPTGILHQSGVTITSLGVNGATPSWDTIIDAAATVRAANIEPDAILWASRTQQTFDKFKDSQGRYLEPPNSLADVSRLVTNQIPINLTTGTSTDCSEIYVGRWSDVLVGIRTDLRFQVKVLQERFIDNLQYGLLLYLRADVALAHPAGFNVLLGVRA